MNFKAFVPAGAASFVTLAGTALSIGELPFFLWIVIFGARNVAKPNNTSMRGGEKP
jgi:hypothetical protein